METTYDFAATTDTRTNVFHGSQRNSQAVLWLLPRLGPLLKVAGTLCYLYFRTSALTTWWNEYLTIFTYPISRSDCEPMGGSKS